MWRSIAVGVVLAGVLAGCSLGRGSAHQSSGELRGVLALSSAKGTSPIPFARVQAVKITGGAGSPTSTLSLFGVAADRLGRFTVKLPVGRYKVSLVLKGGTAHVHQTVVIREGHVSRVQLVELTP